MTGQRCSPYNRTGEWDSVFVGYSRDGFSWSRPVIDGKHRVFLDMNNDPAPPWRWNKANVQSVGGGFLVVDGDEKMDALRFYVGARSGLDQIIGNATVGFATLRRDGFASVEVAPRSAAATVTTHPVTFSGKHFFVNVGTKAAASDGAGSASSSVVVSIVDDAPGKPIAPFTTANCVPVATDSVRQEVTWKGAADLSAVVGTKVRFVFGLHGAAQLFSFWASPSKCGESRGYVAAGGRGFTGTTENDEFRFYHKR